MQSYSLCIILHVILSSVTSDKALNHWYTRVVHTITLTDVHPRFPLHKCMNIETFSST